MAYEVEICFAEKYEFMNSLHTFICRKSHKKIDLADSWATEVREKLSPSFCHDLEQREINYDWKLAYLLVMLCPKDTIQGVIRWLEQMSVGELYEAFAVYGNQFPEDMKLFREDLLGLFTQWNEQYFQHVDQGILACLGKESEQRLEEQKVKSQQELIDDITNGLVFEATQGLEKLILIPHYHFQPINIIYNYGKTTLCQYSPRIDLYQQQFMSLYDYRVIRSVAEKSRLKILNYLYEGPRTFIEIVRYLKLSKGITHDHLSKLRSAGLVYAHFENENLILYSIRTKAISDMQQIIMNYIAKPVESP